MKSVFLISMHKAGSTILDEIVMDFALEKKYKIERISLGVPSAPMSEDEYFIQYQEKMNLEGVYYGVARGPYIAHMPILPKLKNIIQIRDPRDCITSAYFSFKVSHVPPQDPAQRAAFEDRRKALQDMDIDSYALTQIDSYNTRMQIIRDFMSKSSDALPLKYEHMVTDTPGWLRDISNFLEQPLSDSLYNRLGRKIDFSTKSEDINRHKRQVTPGDHRRKLKPDTIDKMTKGLQSHLKYFKYI